MDEHNFRSTVPIDSGDEKIPLIFETINALADVCQSNIQYFELDNTMVGERFLNAFRSIIGHLVNVRLYVAEFGEFMHEYDLDDMTPANGYRSIMKAAEICISQSTKICRYIAKHHGHVLFRKKSHVK